MVNKWHLRTGGRIGLLVLLIALSGGCQSGPYGTLEVRNIFGGNHLLAGKTLRLIPGQGGGLYLDPLWLADVEAVPLTQRTQSVDGISFAYYCGFLNIPLAGGASGEVEEHVFALLPKRTAPDGMVVLYEHRVPLAIDAGISVVGELSNAPDDVCGRFERHGGYAHMAD